MADLLFKDGGEVPGVDAVRKGSDLYLCIEVSSNTTRCRDVNAEILSNLSHAVGRAGICPANRFIPIMARTQNCFQ